jgi:hypothetical protein
VSIDIGVARKRAEEEFFDDSNVTGIGIAGGSNPILVFFVRKPSRQLEAQILRWSRSQGVPVSVRVTGEILPAV